MELNLPRIEHEDIDAAGREILHVGHRGLSLGASEGFLNGRHVVEL